MQRRLATVTLLTALPFLTSLAAALAACGEPDTSDPPDDAAEVETIDVSAPAAPLVPGATIQLTAVARGADGRVLTDRALAWSSSEPTVATISASGRVTAIAPGEVLVAAEADGVVGALLLVVDEPSTVVASLDLSPAGDLTLDRGASVRVTATARDAGGAVVDDAVITWATDDEAVASVTAIGEVTARTAGATWITATAGDVTARLRVIVSDASDVASVEISESGPVPLVPGDGLALHARAYTAGGELVEDRPVAWSTSADTVATVDVGGFVQAHGYGTARITATIDGHAATVDVIVSPVARIEVTPGEAVLFANEELAAGVTLLDARSAPLVYPVAWSSDQPAVATVDGTGRVHAIASGVATIAATAGGRRATIRISVVASGVHTLTAIDGQALPAEMYSTREPGPGGGTITQRVVIDSGTFFVSTIARQYHLTLWGMVHRDGEPPVLTSFEHFGTLVWDAATGRTRYISDEGLDELVGEMQPDGRHQIAFPLDGGGVIRELTFARD